MVDGYRLVTVIIFVRELIRKLLIAGETEGARWRERKVVIYHIVYITWLLGQILALSVSNTLKTSKPYLVGTKSDGVETKSIFYGCTSWSTLCEILMPVGNSTWLLGQILVFSVSNTLMYVL